MQLAKARELDDLWVLSVPAWAERTASSRDRVRAMASAANTQLAYLKGEAFVKKNAFRSDVSNPECAACGPNGCFKPTKADLPYSADSCAMM